MGTKIIIKTAGLEVEAELNDTETAKKMTAALPFEADVRTWGDEIYFSVPVTAELENAKEVVEMGDVAYWPTGKAMCIFFGPTPMSSADEIRPASAVNIVGKVSGDPTVFKQASDGDTIEISAKD